MINRNFSLPFWIISLFLVLLVGCRERDMFAGQSNQTVRLCYIPFASETYAAISRSDFDIKCSNLGDVPLDAPVIVELLAAVRQATTVKKFDDRVVRLSLLMPDKSVVFINQNGEVISGEETVKIPQKAMEELDGQLRKLEQRIYHH